MTLLGPPAGFVLQRLAVDFLKSLADGANHVPGFCDTDKGMIANFDSNFGNVAMFFGSEDDVRIEGAAEEFLQFCKAVFNLLADRGSDFVLPSGVLNIHELPLVLLIRISNTFGNLHLRFTWLMLSLGRIIGLSYGASLYSKQFAGTKAQ